MAQVILFIPSNGVLLDKMDIWLPWPLIYISVKVHKEYTGRDASKNKMLVNSKEK